MADRVGQVFGNYRLIRLLGRGGFSDVYLGQHLRLSAQLAAIKILGERLSEEDVRVFEQEAQTVASLVHPHIARLLDYDVADGTPFLVMDYAPKGSLRQRHRRGEQVPLQTVIAYVKQVAEGLQYAHDQRIIHRDVKPDNMLIGARNEIILSDFGIAAVAHSTNSQTMQAAFGTISYMAPEQLREHPRPASDQYALGVTVYEWLIGERPFQGSFAEIVGKHAMMPPPPLRERLPALSPRVEQVVLRALAKEPQDRFASVMDFASALEFASQTPTGVALPQSTPSPLGRVFPPIRPGVSGTRWIDPEEEKSTVYKTPQFPSGRRWADPEEDTPTEHRTPRFPSEQGWADLADNDITVRRVAPQSPPVSNPGIITPRTPPPTPTPLAGPYNYPVTPIPPPPPEYSQPMPRGVSSPVLPAVKPRRRVRRSFVVLLALLAVLLIGGGVLLGLRSWFAPLRGSTAAQATATAQAIVTAQTIATASAVAGTVIASNGGQVVNIKIAIDLPLSGPFPVAAQQANNGAQMAVDEANAALFLPGYHLVLEPQDDRSNSDIGKQNVTNWIGDAEVAGIIGPFDDSVAMAEMPLTNQAPLVQVSPSTENTCLTQGPPVRVCSGGGDQLGTLRPTGKVTYFRLSATDDQEGAASADYAFQTLHYLTAFVIDNKTTYGIGHADAFVQRFQADGGTVLQRDSLDVTANYSQELTKIASLRPDVVYFAGRDYQGAQVFRQQMISTPGLETTPFEGDGGIKNDVFASAVGTGGGPVYAAMVNITGIDPQFMSRYVAKYARKQFGDFSASGYDSAWILLRAIKSAIQADFKPPLNSSSASAASLFRQAVIDQVARTDYNGVAGHQSFDANGDTTHKTFKIYKLAGGWKSVASETL